VSEDGKAIAEELAQIHGLLQDIAGVLFEIAGAEKPSGGEDKVERYMDGTPK